MATLILTAVGSAVGGPIGGAIGSVLGQYVDQNVMFAPKARRGPRLGDLAVQTSSYGTAIPKIFGTMRVAGTVIWATDLIESRSTSSGGKGRPKQVSYNYSASFAVALSGRPIRAVRRIWADGKLLRGEAGDFKSRTDFRLHRGSEDQAADPMIASAEGLNQTPAFRGLAYAVFENFQLADYGNRIPSLTFEVEADAGAITVGTIAQELSGSALVEGQTPAMLGYAVLGDSVRSAIEALADVAPVFLLDLGHAIEITVGGSSGLLREEEQGTKREIIRHAAGSVPDEASIAYYEPERDYQTGLQRATTGNAAGRHADRRALPAALSANGAKVLAEFRLAELRAGRARAKVQVGWSRCATKPGAVVTLQGESGPWRVRRWSLGPMLLDLELVRTAGASQEGVVGAQPGRAVTAGDLLHGPTTLRLFDLPLGDPRGAQPLLFAAAAGSEEGWRRAALMASFDDGGSWRDAGTTAAPAVLGRTLTELPAAPPSLFDDVSTIEVELLNEVMWLENADDDGLVGGGNLALVGDELVQFGKAEWLGGCRFRLSRLLRGRRGTEWAAALHQAGDAFTLIEADSLAALETPAGMSEGVVRLSATGTGDVEAASVALPVRAESLRPPSPVHLRAERLGSGDILIRWVRRSRLGWSWPSGSDTPLGEEAEAYRLTLSGASFERSLDLNEPSYIYTAAQQAADGAAGAIQFAVVQVGTYAASRAASVILV